MIDAQLNEQPEEPMLEEVIASIKHLMHEAEQALGLLPEDAIPTEATTETVNNG